MASVLNTNMASISAQRYLTNAQNKLASSFEKLSSGSRINRAQDDAAGMGISQKLTASINATSMAVRNANDAVGVIQTAEGALAEISAMLQRFKELSVQGANAALSSTQRGFLATEMAGLQSEITAVSARTKFNGAQLLNNNGTMSFQTGEATSDSIDVVTVNINGTGNFASVTSLLSSTTFGSTGVNGSNATTAFTALAITIDSAIDQIATQRATFGAQVNRLGHNLNNLSALYENLSAANSRVIDTDYANETANLTKTQILQQAATAMLSQANSQPNVVLALLK